MKAYRPFSIFETLFIIIMATVLSAIALAFGAMLYWHVMKNDNAGQSQSDNDGYKREVSLAQVMGSLPQPEVKEKKKVEKKPPPKKEEPKKVDPKQVEPTQVEKKREPKKETPKKKVETPPKKIEPKKPALEKITKPEPKPKPETKPEPKPEPKTKPESKPEPQKPVTETVAQPNPSQVTEQTTEKTTAQNAQPAQQAVQAGNADKNSKQVIDAGALRGIHISYAKQLVQWLKRHIIYPDEIKYTGETYRVTIQFSVDISGNLKDIRIVKTSDNQALDKSILQSGRLASPFPAPPVELHKTELTYEIPVSFITD